MGSSQELFFQVTVPVIVTIAIVAWLRIRGFGKNHRIDEIERRLDRIEALLGDHERMVKLEERHRRN